MEITVNQLAKGVYEISNQMNTIRLEYSRNMRYSTLDGKYHPGCQGAHESKGCGIRGFACQSGGKPPDHRAGAGGD